MSRWTEAKLETLSNIESEYFYGALDKMGYKADFSKKTLSRSYEGDSKNVDCVITTKAGVPINVGLRFKEGEDELTEEDKQNRADIKKAFSYDPFETKPISQRPMLYRSLSQMIDPTLNNDLVRQRAAIEIVTNYEEIDRLDVAIAKLSLTPDDIVKNAKDLETLRKMKSDVNKNISMLCKDHGLSAKYANSKSRGAGTLSGIMRDMEESNYDDGKTNLYDIETSESMQQCSDISAKSIMSQLRLSDSDYAQMVEEQAVVVRKEIAARKQAEEALRLCKEYLRKQELIVELIKEYKRKGIPTEEIEELLAPEFKDGKQ